MTVIMSVGLLSCGDDDPEPEPPYVHVNGLDETSLEFGPNSGISYKQSVEVTSNESWRIDNVPEWLSVSPRSGNGTVRIEMYPKSDNDKDDKPRTASLIIQSNSASARIIVTQETALNDGAMVTPTNIVTLYNGIAFDYKFGKDVSYYYRGYIETNQLGSMTESEIIKTLEENFARYTINDNEVGVFSGLDAGTSYTICVVGYNKDGKRGKLVKEDVRTKQLKNNEPIAWIGEFQANASKWYWETTKSATCDSYYMMATENSDLGLSPDVYQAWLIDAGIRSGELSEYVNGGNWSMTRKSNAVFVFTWGLDRQNNFAGKINWDYAIINSSSPKKIQKSLKNEKVDKNYPKFDKSEYAIYMRQ